MANRHVRHFGLPGSKLKINKNCTEAVFKPDARRKFKKFVFASYNAGEGTIKTAREKAAARGLDNTRWEEIIKLVPVTKANPQPSALHEAIVAHAKRGGLSAELIKNPGKKYKETTDYVERIFTRLSNVKP